MKKIKKSAKTLLLACSFFASLSAAEVQYYTSNIAIKSIKTGKYITQSGKELLQGSDKTIETLFKIVKDPNNPENQKNTPVSYGETVYLMSAKSYLQEDTSLFVGDGGEKFFIYAASHVRYGLVPANKAAKFIIRGGSGKLSSESPIQLEDTAAKDRLLRIDIEWLGNKVYSCKDYLAMTALAKKWSKEQQIEISDFVFAEDKEEKPSDKPAEKPVPTPTPAKPTPSTPTKPVPQLISPTPKPAPQTTIDKPALPPAKPTSKYYKIVDGKTIEITAEEAAERASQNEIVEKINLIKNAIVKSKEITEKQDEMLNEIISKNLFKQNKIQELIKPALIDLFDSLQIESLQDASIKNLKKLLTDTKNTLTKDSDLQKKAAEILKKFEKTKPEKPEAPAETPTDISKLPPPIAPEYQSKPEEKEPETPAGKEPSQTKPTADTEKKTLEKLNNIIKTITQTKTIKNDQITSLKTTILNELFIQGKFQEPIKAALIKFFDSLKVENLVGMPSLSLLEEFLTEANIQDIMNKDSALKNKYSEILKKCKEELKKISDRGQELGSALTQSLGQRRQSIDPDKEKSAEDEMADFLGKSDITQD